MTLGEMISKGKHDFADKVAIKFKDKTWTYCELDSQVNKVANGLKKLGVQKGDRIAILMPNNPYFIIGYFAITRLGAGQLIRVYISRGWG